MRKLYDIIDNRNNPEKIESRLATKMKTLNVVAAIIIFDKKILCMQRGNSKYEYTSNKFEFPGGKVEPNESRPEALMRELKEELGIKAKIADEDFALTVHHQYPDFEITMHCYYCRPASPEFTMKEHISYKWLSMAELHSFDWAAADIPVVKYLQNTKGEI